MAGSGINKAGEGCPGVLLIFTAQCMCFSSRKAGPLELPLEMIDCEGDGFLSRLHPSYHFLRSIILQMSFLLRHRVPTWTPCQRVRGRHSYFLFYSGVGLGDPHIMSHLGRHSVPRTGADVFIQEMKARVKSRLQRRQPRFKLGSAWFSAVSHSATRGHLRHREVES